MGIPFRDQDEVDALGFAGYLKLAHDGDEYSGAIFIINARGEPVHFLCNQVRVINRFMWREADLALGARRRLLQSLFSACPVTPVLMLCQASEASEQLFESELHGALVVGRITTGERLEVTWYPRAPTAGTRAFTLWELLSSRGLLHEPFTRAAKGMTEMLRTTLGHKTPSEDSSTPAPATGGT